MRAKLPGTWWRRARYVLVLVALCSIATCPAAKRACVAKHQAEEADQLLAVIGDRVAEAVAETGRVPLVPAPPTPVPSCCDQGGACTADDRTWNAPGWRALRFTIDGTYRFTYEYAPDPSGTFAIARAVGDLNCDGTQSLYELRLVVHDKTVERVWTRKDPYE